MELVVIEIPHQFSPKVYYVSGKEKLIEIASEQKGKSGESLVDEWQRADMDEYREALERDDSVGSSLRAIVAWFEANPEAESCYDLSSWNETKYVAELPEGELYRRAVEEILHDCNSGAVIETLEEWNEFYRRSGHNMDKCRSAMKAFRQSYEWVDFFDTESKKVVAYVWADIPIDGGKTRYPESLEEALSNTDFETVELWSLDNEGELMQCLETHRQLERDGEFYKD